MRTEVWSDGKTHRVTRARDGQFGHGSSLTAMNAAGWARSLSDRMNSGPAPAKKAVPARKGAPKAPEAATTRTGAPRAARVTASQDPAVVAKALDAADTPDEADDILAGKKVTELRAIAKAAGVAVSTRATKAQVQDALHRWATRGGDAPTAPAAKSTPSRAKPKSSSKRKPKAADLLGQTDEGITAGFAKVMNGTYAGLEVRVESGSTTRNGVQVRAKIYRDGKEVGNVTRIIGRDKRGDLYANHAYLEIQPQVRGQGFAEQFNAAMEDWYRESGVKRIELVANIDVGGYAWARQGYDFPGGTIPKPLVSRLRQIVKSGSVDTKRKRVDVDSREAAKLLKLIESGREFSAYELSQYGRPEGAGRDDWWVGKAVLMGSEWVGVRWL